MNTQELRNKITNGGYDEKIKYIYSACDTSYYNNRLLKVIDGLEEHFGKKDDVRLFSAPGRTEIGGNHTDHQHGCVLAASLNLDVIGAVSLNGTDVIRIKSEGYPMDEIKLSELEVQEAEIGKARSLIRGIAAKFTQMGYKLQGFDAYTISDVLKGSGMSSSAAFEVLVGTIINGLFANGEVDAVEIAKIGQYAENVFFGKPCGLMDQMASSVGSIVAIDFADTENPKVEKVEFDFTKTDHALCIIDSGADHADLTDEYADITIEMRLIANFFGKDYLREVSKSDFMAKLPEVREAVKNDRAIIRAMHYFNDSNRAQDEVAALKDNDFSGFLSLLKKSGYSSYMYLQNVYAASAPKAQAVSLSLALLDELLGERGAYRVHGGGFAGTVQAFVPNDILSDVKNKIDFVLGDGMCHVLSIRPVGGIEI